MALINCPECTHKISDQSASCTNCGFPIAKPAPFKATPPSYEELKRLKERNLDKAFEELEELEEYRESKWIEHTLMFIISCIIIYLISKEEIHYILQNL